MELLLALVGILVSWKGRSSDVALIRHLFWFFVLLFLATVLDQITMLLIYPQLTSSSAQCVLLARPAINVIMDFLVFGVLIVGAQRTIHQ